MMKYNLKYFPVCDDSDSIAKLMLWMTETEEWIMGFEAELREKMKGDICHGCVDRDSCVVCAKEIFG